MTRRSDADEAWGERTAIADLDAYCVLDVAVATGSHVDGVVLYLSR